MKKTCAFTINFRNDPNGSNIYDIELLGDNYFYSREISNPTVRIYDIKSGVELHTFQIGGDIDNVDTDDFPICIVGSSIYALKSEDRKTICCWDAETGKIVKTFDPAPQDISGIFYSDGRLIASCQIGAGNVSDKQSLVVFWDLNDSKIFKVVAGPKGFYTWVMDITDGKLMLFVQKINSDQKMKPLKELLKLKNAEKYQEKFLLSNKRVQDKLKPKYASKQSGTDLNRQLKDSDLSMPFMQLPNNTIHLEFYDCQNCEHIGYIHEDFTPPQVVAEILGNYSGGRLLVDNDSVLIQDFKI